MAVPLCPIAQPTEPRISRDDADEQPQARPSGAAYLPPTLTLDQHARMLVLASGREVGRTGIRPQDRVDGLFQAVLIEGLVQDGAVLEALDQSG
jgi:hypothetical protein